MLLYTGLPLALTLAFLVLTLWAKRGRRIDDHPLCRSCRYDLHGLDLATRPNCPECGQSIDSRQRLRHGNRQPRKPLAITFALLTVLGLATTATTTTLWANDYDWNRLKPVSWLIAEASNPAQPNTMDAALTELQRREAESLLSYHQRIDLIHAALAYQANKTKPWDERWGELISRPRVDGICSQALWEQYIIQAADFELQVRERIAQGDPFVVSGTFPDPFRGDISLRSLEIYRDDALFTIRTVENGKTAGPPVIQFHRHHHVGGTLYFRNHYDGTLFFRNHYSHGLDQLPAGEYELMIETTLWGVEPSLDPILGLISVENGVELKPLELKARFEVFPESASPITPIRDSKLAQQAESYMIASLAQKTLSGRNAWMARGSESEQFYIECNIPAPDIPHHCSFDVEFYIEGEKIDFVEGCVLEPVQTGNYAYYGTSFRLPDRFQVGSDQFSPPTVDKFTMRLIPNPEHLKEEIDGYDYLDHTIELKDIPIRPYR